VFDCYFNFTKKILSHWQVLIQFNTIFDNVVVAYFFGSSCKRLFSSWHHFIMIRHFWRIDLLHLCCSITHDNLRY